MGEKPLGCLGKAHSSCRVAEMDWKTTEGRTLEIHYLPYSAICTVLHVVGHTCAYPVPAEAALKCQGRKESKCLNLERLRADKEIRDSMDRTSKLIPMKLVEMHID